MYKNEFEYEALSEIIKKYNLDELKLHIGKILVQQNQKSVLIQAVTARNHMRILYGNFMKLVNPY